jgi:hypothetical protein
VVLTTAVSTKGENVQKAMQPAVGGQRGMDLEAGYGDIGLVIPAFGRRKQKDCEFEASLGYIARLHSQNNNRKRLVFVITSLLF